MSLHNTIASLSRSSVAAGAGSRFRQRKLTWPLEAIELVLLCCYLKFFFLILHITSHMFTEAWYSSQARKTFSLSSKVSGNVCLRRAEFKRFPISIFTRVFWKYMPSIFTGKYLRHFSSFLHRFYVFKMVFSICDRFSIL